MNSTLLVLNYLNAFVCVLCVYQFTKKYTCTHGEENQQKLLERNRRVDID